MGLLADRRRKTDARIRKLQTSLKRAERLAENKACVYMTGSFGRGEAGKYSDLDLFIVGRNNRRPGSDGRRSSLSHLDEIRITSDLIDVMKRQKIPEFSGDGKYLAHFSVHDLTMTLGAPEDDATNTLTARLLLLLESRPLIDGQVYDRIIKEVIGSYWRDYNDHKSNFMPAFLANDILRLWRTFCVNYEARTERTPAEEKAKGKIKNYKLKHSRLLTCYSALLCLLVIYKRKGTVSPAAAFSMIKLTPTERLQWLRLQPECAAARMTKDKLLKQYERFLRATNKTEQALIKLFSNHASAKKYMSAASTFGDLVFQVLDEIGDDNRFYRLLVV